MLNQRRYDCRIRAVQWPVELDQDPIVIYKQHIVFAEVKQGYVFVDADGMDHLSLRTYSEGLGIGNNLALTL